MQNSGVGHVMVPDDDQVQGECQWYGDAAPETDPRMGAGGPKGRHCTRATLSAPQNTHCPQTHALP